MWGIITLPSSDCSAFALAEPRMQRKLSCSFQPTFGLKSARLSTGEPKPRRLGSRSSHTWKVNSKTVQSAIRRLAENDGAEITKTPPAEPHLPPIAPAGPAYNHRGKKTLAHPDYALIQRWWHSANNSGLPCDYTHGSRKEVWLQCKGCLRCGEVHQWRARAQALSQAAEKHRLCCPFCESKAKFCSCRSIAADEKLLAEWHPDNPKPASEVAVGSNTKRLWLCLAGRGHSQYVASPQSRSINGSGCPKCARETYGKGGHKAVAAERPDLAAEWNEEKNGRPLGDLTCGSGYRAWWRCSECGHNWQAWIFSRANNGTGCPICAHSKRMEPRRTARVLARTAALGFDEL